MKTEESFRLSLFMRTMGRETILMPPSFDLSSTLPYSGKTNLQGEIQPTSRYTTTLVVACISTGKLENIFYSNKENFQNLKAEKK